MDAIWMCCASENTQLCLRLLSNALKLWRKEVSFSINLSVSSCWLVYEEGFFVQVSAVCFKIVS